jgi:SAM-dependent methyltransferase
LEFVWPQPTLVLETYDEAYFRNGYLVHLADRSRRFRHLLKRLKQRGATGPLLDVGAGIGLLVYAAKQENWQAEGIEPSVAACRLSREVCGINLTCGEITEIVPSSEFGIVVLWQVLAHVPDPQEMLRVAARFLRPEGTLLVACIHWDDPHYRLARFVTRWKKVNGLHMPTILWRFREKHLEELAHRAGLSVQSLEYGPRPFRGPFGWKRTLLENAFEAYRKITGMNEEIQLWCKRSTDTSRKGVL